jgi:hypothetical protein
MRLSRRHFALAVGAAALPPLEVRAQRAPPRKLREDSFFGIHFDLHPRAEDKELGRDLTPEMVERFLARVQPDYVQYDCKGHNGYLGYPSEIGPSAGMAKDSLAIWREVTARQGVALYIHFSGVWDTATAKAHPEWARLDADGKRDENNTSTYGPYVDQRMIPQLLEVSAKYDLDGVWVDGECWSTRPDYSPRAAEAFLEATGFGELPKKAGDPGWNEFLEFNREQFRRYVRHYIETVRAQRPRFQIASNWLYSTFVPEKPDLPVDFISGDYLGNASISQARLQARYMGQTGMPWDLMAWGFQSARNNPVGPIHKPAANLMQEASIVLAQGGGFQIYYQPTRTGHVDDRHVNVMARVAAFCRARQDACFQSETVPQVGVVFSGRSLYRTGNKLFGGWGAAEGPAQGMVDALIENHYSVDVIPDWKLAESAASYPCLVLPEWTEVGDHVAAALAEYVRNGGRLLVAGAVNAELFSGVLGVAVSGVASDRPAWIPGEEVFANLRGVWVDVRLMGAEVLLQRYPAFDSTRAGVPAATIARMGQGAVAGFFGPLGSVYSATHAPEVRRLVGRIMSRLYPEPLAEVSAPHTVEVVLRQKAGRGQLHLINTTAMQVAANYAAVDFIPPVGPIHLRLRLAPRPRDVRLDPAGTPLTGRYEDGVFAMSLQSVTLHEVVSWESPLGPPGRGW